ncbi:hypothetical protein EIN_053500 [Entamoeba invadens IP1]|uniref:TLDc domain-containing protein n=1 Tax=Entamoeba invadens TaxID=33085 RepID=S0B2E8_ENTIV|nr:hypothetical protein EIN_053500 [Entamoeba invadens IP1]ELP93105.1 hypothetical protein EIN_053500 [Entamoeba invadens IP1]BAN41369.1 hypothetical protein [Entamoeba invadens]|eukprot:XP_004259876.1 hypothetical protein EIN_053500 [Entamoeba invadens IP1]
MDVIEELQLTIKNVTDLVTRKALTQISCLIEKVIIGNSRKIDPLLRIDSNNDLFSLRDYSVSQPRVVLQNIPKDTFIESGFSFIDKRLKTLEEWSSMKKGYSVIYDTNTFGGQSNKEFFSKIYGKKNLYFFVGTQKGPVYGGYCSKNVTEHGERVKDPNSFIFKITQKSMKKFNLKNEEFKLDCGLYVWINGNNLFQFGDYYGNITVAKTGLNSKIESLGETFECGECEFDKTENHFKVMRIVVIQME